MKFVEPIKDIADINAMKRTLKQHSQRDVLFFVLGINTGIALHDLLYLKVSDVWNEMGAKEFLYIEDASADNGKSFYLNRSIKKELTCYLSNRNIRPKHYLFPSKKDNEPLSRQQAYRIVNQAAKNAGITAKIGTHTLRKTFAYHAYQKGIAISIIAQILNHRSSSETLRYIGVNKCEERAIKVDVNL